ncbi:MAG: GGDEF domain-containing protein, partial [Thiotrichaceae bacterium]|nr:GGDEF domain-containing protein [Thiotrichaceae bacterium]
MTKPISLSLHIAFFVWAIFSLSLIVEIPLRYLPILEILPFALLLLSFILGYRFNRSLVIYSAILFILIYAYPFLSDQLNNQQQTLILNSLIIFLVVNVSLLCFYHERGIFTLIGISRFVLIFAQVGGFFWLIRTQPAYWQQLISQTIFPALEIKLAFFEQSSLLLILISIILISSSYLTRANPFRSAIFVSMFIVLYAITLPATEILSFSALISYALLLPLLTLMSESYRMAFIDELTSLPGRRALNEAMDKLGNQYVIAMLDVDHFKKFNDRYGHDAGDDVLQLLGSRLKSIKGAGKPFRYGGEEFAILFSGTTLKEANEHLQALREVIANKKFALRKQERRRKNSRARKQKQRYVSVTISIGYAEYNDKFTSPSAVLKAADKALYRAKKKGRNCVSR